ncbi:hypothetical protein JCGZ_12857 [Jatropha curcas]|uniref:non-specific serine/threonine protein kinase n=1 Tax=Jatropha curcas TaxID=180498 RepID=A0A067KB03_JATCU|nr:hypothetical protein JCGZ_12857 [Jatropha curcas]
MQSPTSRINLQNNSFHGQIPEEIGNLRRIQDIELANNSFQGNIPSNLSRCSNLLQLRLFNNKLVGRIPMELGSLPKLELLVLAKNNLTGNIPPSIGNLSSIWLLSLGRNGFQGQIPKEISLLKNLQSFLFQENNLIGDIPSGIFNISKLEYCHGNKNKLNGSIPSDLGLTLPKLKHLVLQDNRFTGAIPISLSNASMLEQIDFVANKFSGFVPKQLGVLPHLRYVGFSNNQLQGDLSFIDSLTNCSNLKYLEFSSNFFKGTVPNSIANLSKDLEMLSVRENQLHNVIPLGVENLINLRFFLFGANYFSGPLLIDFGKFQRLHMLDLGGNKLTGTIPYSIGNLSFLTFLDLSFNNLHGSIPSSLGSCHNLNFLALSQNNLSGPIPSQLITLSSLSIVLDLSGNKLTGPVPSKIFTLNNLAQLDLSNNKLSGMIPNSIGKYLSLEQLYLQENSFGGNIPLVLTSLTGLRELDISSNNLSGQIPDSFANLHGLNYFNLSFNQLKGEVPKHGIFLNASVVSLQGNVGLCGGIPELKLPPCAFQTSNKNNRSFPLKVIISVVFAVIFFSLLICFWYRKKFTSKNISMPSFSHKFLRISYAELFKATNGFSVANIIGVGSYGSVYKGFLEQSRIQVAVKVLNLQQRGASNSFLSECQALRATRHRNLLKLLSVCSSIDSEGNDFKALIYEFMENGSLEKWLHAQSVGEDGQERESRNLKLIDRLNIAIDIATAIEYLHTGSSTIVIHGDLKPSNVLLDENMTAHIGDFGLAKIVSTIYGDTMNPSTSLAIKGSIGYVAPEYGMGEPVSKKGDVYSYGILLLEMFTGKRPTDDFFKDDLNLHTFVERSLPYEVTNIIDRNIILVEDGGESFKDAILFVLRIGVACTMEQPGERMEMQDVINELQKVKSSYLKGLLVQNPRNAYQFGGPSSSHI